MGTPRLNRSQRPAIDDEILPSSAAAQDDMDVRIVGIPVVDTDPVEPGGKILFGLGHQFAGEAFQILKIDRLFRRDDEAEVVAIFL
ncbi:hypothetical protein Sinme_6738 (plasmid) [Sinorhizobium meliloti AK83]|nr:hypothetical protein Sinme_6738 [Sinorhizobium meliloti AK83]SEJ89105.1 hypothetical protein SAMN04244575_06792 [Sinorhizobium meliloti]